MTAEPDLLPSSVAAFTEALKGERGSLDAWLEVNDEREVAAHVEAYARACVSSATEALRAKAAEARDGWHMANGTADLAMKHRDAAEARAERMAEALRDLLNIGDKFTGDKDEDAATWCAVNDAARAALEQETTNG